ncbi:MAG: VWA domain-containing protein [Planctomycetes bacterium]|nr:VWA domain-containing protein [Planctomycetota bacterium]
MSFIRRLPIYLLLDNSESMVGDPLAAVNQGLQQLCYEVKSDPMAIETAWLSVITFGGKARVVCPLTEVLQFSPPPLYVGPGTNLGAGLDLLAQSIRTEVRKSSAEQRGDWRPIIFLMTDGQPTDNWRDSLNRFRAAVSPKDANIIAIGCGEDVDMDVLKAITPVSLLMKTLSSGALQAFFKWVSASVSTASVRVGGEGKPFELPALPNGVEMPTHGAPSSPHAASQLILLSRCQKDGQLYLMRYRRGGPGYAAEKAYPVGRDYASEVSSGNAGLEIDASQLSGSPACPYCGNPGFKPLADKSLMCHDRLELRGGRAQVMFVLDITGSMSGEIEGVKNNIKDFMDYIHSEGLSAEVGLIAFRDLEEDEPPEVLMFQGKPFTKDPGMFKSQVSRLDANGGGANDGESSLDAVVLACRQPFESGVTRIVILITDEPPLIPDGRVHSLEDVASALQQARIDQLHIVAPDYLQNHYTSLHHTVKGDVFDLDSGARGGSTFRKILLDIGKSISIATRVG